MTSAIPSDCNPTTNTGVWAGEYTTFTGVVSGNNYQFSSSTSTDWLVVTNTSNVVLASGTTPVSLSAGFTGDVRVHVSTNSSCGTQNAGRNISATRTGCPPNPCAGAINIPSVPVTNQALVCGSSNNLNSGNSSVCGGASSNYMGGNEAIYTFTPTVSGTYTISYSGQTWSAIWVHSGDCPASGGTCVGSVGNSANS